MAIIDDNLAKSITEVLRLSQLDLMNQDAFFNSVNDTVVITRADGTQLTIKSASGLMNATGTVGGKTGGTVTTPVNATGSLGIITNASSFGALNFIYPSTLKTMAYGFCENYGDLVFVTTAATVAGTEKYFSMRQNGNFSTQGNISCSSLTQTSDADKKTDVAPITDALSRLARIDGVTFKWVDSELPSAGVIAQKLLEVLPEAVGSVFDDYDQYQQVEEMNGEGEIVVVNRLVRKRDESKRSYTVEYSGVVALCVQAIKELKTKVETLEKQSKKQANMEAFLKAMGYNPETDYTATAENQ